MVNFHLFSCFEELSTLVITIGALWGRMNMLKTMILCEAKNSL